MSAADPKPTSATGPSSQRPVRVWLFRLLAVAGIPAVLLLALEGALRLAGFGQPAAFLIPDTLPGCYRTNPDYLHLFMPRSFDLRPLNLRVAARKPPHTVRVVVLGESAAEGVPEPMFGFVPQLRAQLRAAHPGQEIEIINTGIVAIDSHVVYQIARELARFSPDLFVVYLGNNEVVGPYGPGCTYLSTMPPLWVIRASVFVRSTRIGQLLTAGLDWLARRRGQPPDWGGMAMFADSAVVGDDPRLAAVYRNFETNLRDIVRTGTAAGAKVLLCTVVSNLKDCAPFLSRHRPNLTDADAELWRRAFYRGRLEWLLGEAGPAQADLQAALKLDPEYADTLFMLGSLELRADDVAAARAHLFGAEHWDALRFRPEPRINEIIRTVGRAGGPAVAVVDAATALGSDPASAVRPAGRELLYEHVHFNWDGSYRLARLLAQGAEALLWPGESRSPTWLDSAGCAAALAYTPHEQASVLRRVTHIVQNPPFTNQLTYVADEALLARELARARAAAVTPQVLEQAAAVVRSAIAADPANPALAKIAEGIADDRGDLAEALAQVRRAQQLQPDDFALHTDEAVTLARLGRYGEAEALLRRTARDSPPRDRALMATAFADLFTRTGRFAEGRRFFDEAIRRRPDDFSLRLLRGRLARLAGDPKSAEADYRAALKGDPANPDALEMLVSFLGETGRSAEAEEVSLAAVERQPHNQVNNLRAMLIYGQRGDTKNSVRLLEASEHSGPVTAAVELRLARQVRELGSQEESLFHLALAERLSRIEDDAETTRQIAQLIEALRAENP